jgi:hypothetical protein
MPSPAKPCALCLLNKPLLASHFLPAAIYKNLIDPTGPIKNMIASNLSTASTASEESKQVKQYLLCQDCEICFQRGGENWILGRRLMPNGGFELRDLLRQATPVGTQGEASFFALNTVPSFEREQLLYFAASIFWRAAVADWETPVGHYTKLAVEPGVVEELRKYLLCSAPFPSDVCSIVVIFSAADAPKQLTTLPHATTGPTECQQFDWYMPGIGFTLLIGKLPVGMQAISVSQSPHCVAIDPKLDQRITAAGVKHAQESTATEKLQKKIDQTGSNQN